MGGAVLRGAAVRRVDQSGGDQGDRRRVPTAATAGQWQHHHARWNSSTFGCVERKLVQIVFCKSVFYGCCIHVLQECLLHMLQTFGCYSILHVLQAFSLCVTFMYVTRVTYVCVRPVTGICYSRVTGPCVTRVQTYVTPVTHVTGPCATHVTCVTSMCDLCYMRV